MGIITKGQMKRCIPDSCNKGRVGVGGAVLGKLMSYLMILVLLKLPVFCIQDPHSIPLFIQIVPTLHYQPLLDNVCVSPRHATPHW